MFSSIMSGKSGVEVRIMVFGASSSFCFTTAGSWVISTPSSSAMVSIDVDILDGSTLLSPRSEPDRRKSGRVREFERLLPVIGDVTSEQGADCVVMTLGLRGALIEVGSLWKTRFVSRLKAELWRFGS